LKLLVGAVIVTAFGATLVAVWKPALLARVWPWGTHGRFGAASGQSVDFHRDVQPIFDQNCVKCHGPEKQKGGLRFDSKAAALKPGESGELAIAPGNPGKSALLYRVVSHDPDEKMPPKGEPLSAGTVSVLKAWIAEGAAWPENGTPAESVTSNAAGKTKHWAFQPLSKVGLPAVKDAAWTSTPIDRIVLAAQEAKGLHPNPEAPRRTLIRRLYFDLLGLPPTPEEIDAFERDPSPAAYEHLVDKLLADPHYGERWGRHWLDVARYADSNGYEEDRPRYSAYPYRDFVIRALNSDLPYDRFIQWQIAGDLLEPHNAEAVAATGFITAAPNVRPDFINYREKDRWDELDNIVSTTGSAILGLTLGCARCHDHKFDPIPSADYYRLTAFFTSTERVERPLVEKQGKEYEQAMAHFDQKRLDEVKSAAKEWKERKRVAARNQVIDALPITAEEKALLRAPVDAKNKQQYALLNEYASQLTISDSTLRKGLNAPDRAKWASLDATEEEILATMPQPIPRMLTVGEGKPKKSYLLLRGNPDQKGPEVAPSYLSIFTPPSGFSVLQRFSLFRKDRTDLARWLTDVKHGAGVLTARVAVNRLWQHHFGRGIVATPGDFGLRGDPPSNPALLDWMAGELIQNGWRLKQLQKLILMSAVYRQDDAIDQARMAIDPGNRLWWRREPQRVEAEILRDSILAVSGNLNPQFFGPGTKPRMNPEAIAITNPEKRYDQWPANVVDSPKTWRRSIYIFVKRGNLFPFLQVFDASDAITSCTRRNPTTVAPQALTFLNDPFIREQARAFAARLVPLGSLEKRVCAAFDLALGREPTPEEKARALQFIEHQQNDQSTPPTADTAESNALTDFCQGLLALNEFCYID
jgi:mono/diheme cytochrome c family protein